MNVPGSFSATGTLAGINGTLNLSGGNYQFTRASSGSATAVAADTPFIPTLGIQHKASGTFIWAGKNDITSGGDMNTIADAVTKIAKTGGLSSGQVNVIRAQILGIAARPAPG